MSLPKLDIALEIVTDPDDVPRINQIGVDAFTVGGDTHTSMKMAERGATDPASEMAGDEMAYIISKPDKATLLKAVEKTSGKIVGSAAWGLWHYDGTKPSPPEGEEDPRVKDPAPGLRKPAADEPPVEHLNYLTSMHFRVMEATVLLPLGVKTLYCLGISVDPEYQGRGVGSKLIQWATKKADEDGVKAWVHSSEAGWRAFAKNGFEIVETLTVDLDKYATKPRLVDGKEAKWGEYNFRYMVYTPKSVVEHAR